ncbi:MAG TPA: tRNA isopentenyl-2-thiomethyl-A-37 hydroxylase MiaE [Myxococcota bacterium]|nr:tRNA isopentenyl-2-thiomethyl-A-37 hydroxylase MiaE [Myxococcota bacterium]
MLNLASTTEPVWAERALTDLPALLLDHAHCEKRAAGMAIGLISRYSDRGALLAPLARLAREELEHFERLLGVLERRGIAFGVQEPAPYAKRLLGLARTFEPARLVDTLLCCSAIEARSCERFGVLAAACDAAGEAELAGFYRDLRACEARHHELYVRLAETAAPRDEVRARLRELLALEADLVAKGTSEIRLHG